MNWDAYLEEFYASIDAMDPPRFAAFFSEGGSFKFANHPPAIGHAKIAAVAKGVFDHLRGIAHEITNRAVGGNGDLFLEGKVIYHRRDDRKIELPFACVFEFSPHEPGERKLISNYRSYVDAAPLFAD